MKKYLFLIALWFAFLVPDFAHAAARFWVGGTGTWDGSNTTNWAATSGGAGGQSVPSTSDDVTFDANSGGGTVTVNTTVTIISLTMSAFTGTLDFSANNNNVTLSAGTAAFTNTGSGTRTLNMGNGVWTLSGATALWTQASATNLTFNANGSTIAFTGAGAKDFRVGASRTYNIVTVAGSSTGYFQISNGASTIGTLTVSAPNRVAFAQGTTTTVTNFTNITATSSTPVLLSSANLAFGTGTVSSANNFACTWCGVVGLVFTGGGTFSATNSLDFGGNTGVTITPPSAGGGGGRIIGG